MIRNTLMFYCVIAIGVIIEGRDRFMEVSSPHENESTECRGKRMLISDQMKDVKCMPRKTLVKLRPELGYVYVPDMVPVNRCSGFCGPTVCIPAGPLSWMRKNVVVRRYSINSNKSTCHLVRVIEHTKCKCGCDVMEEDCNSKQLYLEEECACKCMNFEDNLKCNKQKGMMWDSKNCKCVCDTPEQECSSGYEWIPSMCSCGKVMMTDVEEK